MTKSTALSGIACRWLLITGTAVGHCLVLPNASAAQIDIAEPMDSGEFGGQVLLLPNGKFVVTDPYFDEPGSAADVGAVHLYGRDGVLLYTLRGSSTGDRIDINGLLVQNELALAITLALFNVGLE